MILTQSTHYQFPYVNDKEFNTGVYLYLKILKEKKKKKINIRSRVNSDDGIKLVYSKPILNRAQSIRKSAPVCGLT